MKKHEIVKAVTTLEWHIYTLVNVIFKFGRNVTPKEKAEKAEGEKVEERSLAGGVAPKWGSLSRGLRNFLVDCAC